MPVTAVKIHPAIGVARVGNSPDFFVGPERPLERPAPPGGFKDSACRVKRQAARFRLFAYDGATLVKELTAADADVEWTVQLVNRKADSDQFGGSAKRNASVPSADRGKLVIDPGPRTLTGPNQEAKLDTGTFTYKSPSETFGPVTVPLGEIRTDPEGHLLVLGGAGASGGKGELAGEFADNDKWYDDISDGPVTAKVTLKGGGGVLTASPAWVVVAPPKFAPHIDHAITLYDRLLDFAVSQAWLSAPSKPSLTKDVFPILRRAVDVRWVQEIGSVHSTFDTFPFPLAAPARQAIFNKLRNPAGGGGNMPKLYSESFPMTLALDQAVTSIQYAMMKKWSEGTFTDDWAGLPAPPASLTPQGMDRAALEACVGAALYPGIEAGQVLLQAGIWKLPFEFRLDSTKLKPGDLTARMALPWQSDFMACTDYWWPAHRPNQVIPQGATSSVEWMRDIPSRNELVTEWSSLGFVVPEGKRQVETEVCKSTYVVLVTPSLSFLHVSQGVGGKSRKTARAIVFEVQSPSAVTLEVTAGPAHARLTLPAASVTVGPAAGAPVLARLWVQYETGIVGDVLSDSVTVKRKGTTSEWIVPISADTVGRKKTAAALVLDRSYSMTEPRGDSEQKIRSLREAAGIFVDVMLEGDGLGLVRYNENAQVLSPFAALGAPDDALDPGRMGAKGKVNGPDLDPAGHTSIGDGVHEGRVLVSAAAGYDQQALIVMTDGKENRAKSLADVAGEINQNTYAIGLGKPENISVAALQTLSGNNGGYLLVTGAISGDNQFLLVKYFLQILAGISSAEIIADPQGLLRPGEEHRIPFLVTGADTGLDAILLCRAGKAVDFQLEAPDGSRLTSAMAAAAPAIAFVPSAGVTYYRFSLPAALAPGRSSHGGRWHVVLRFPGRRSGGNDDAVAGQPAASAVVGGLPYSVVVHAYSDVAFSTRLKQSGHDPGARVFLGAALTEGEIPLVGRASVTAELAGPAGPLPPLPLFEDKEGQFAAGFITTAPGVYNVRLRAFGRTSRGEPFQRERTHTAAVWEGGDRDSAEQPPREDGCCALLSCLLDPTVLTPKLQRELQERGLDVEALRSCVKQACGPAGAGAPQEQAAQALLRALRAPDFAAVLRTFLGGTEQR
ncbi:MAG: VWA domain-containing protein [Planctomycetes bacterium]|nr:VWA domain-containing protein [Planctomycetota bacterium]